MERVELVPDGGRAVLVGLRLRAPEDPRRLHLVVDAHSELMSAYPWGETEPSQLDFNGRDRAGFDGRALVFTEGAGRGAARNWAAVVAADEEPVDHAVGRDFRGPRSPAVVCPPSLERAPWRCDDTAYGRGAGGAPAL
jgi:hypothetical protein